MNDHGKVGRRSEGPSPFDFLPYVRYRDLEEFLGRLFEEYIDGGLSIDELRDRAYDIYDLTPDDGIDKLLDEAMGFIGELHDEFAKEELRQSTRTIQNHADRLMGRESREYFLKPEPFLQIKVTYLRTS